MFTELRKYPGIHHLPSWADWAELLACMNGGLSVDDFSSEIEQNKENIPSQIDDEKPDMDTGEDELGLAERSVAEFNDKCSRRSIDVFSYIRARAEAFGGDYPFDVDVDGRYLELRESTVGRKVYLFLLAASLFRYMGKKSDQTRIAAEFEWLAVEALKCQLPTHSKVHLFGSNSIKPGRYQGLLRERIDRLGSDLNEDILLDLSEFTDDDRGDNGLDIVGWVPMADGQRSMLISFGQCACTTKWVDKQLSSSRDAWAPIFNFATDPVNFCFIPHDFRDLSGNWFRRRYLRKSLLMDRRRIIDSFRRCDDGSVVIPKALDGVIDFDFVDSCFRVY